MIIDKYQTRYIKNNIAWCMCFTLGRGILEPVISDLGFAFRGFAWGWFVSSVSVGLVRFRPYILGAQPGWCVVVFDVFWYESTLEIGQVVLLWGGSAVMLLVLVIHLCSWCLVLVFVCISVFVFVLVLVPGERKGNCCCGCFRGVCVLLILAFQLLYRCLCSRSAPGEWKLAVDVSCELDLYVVLLSLKNGSQ